MKIPFLNNLRRGFATNSSSSHSLIHFKKPQSPSHSKSTKVNTSGFELEYHWEDFRLTTVPEKLFYALIQMIGNGGYWEQGEADANDREIDEKYEAYGHLFPEFTKDDFRFAFMGSIDHESRYGLDAKNLVEYARDPNVVIFGGNDNGGTTVTTLLEDNKDVADWGVDLGWGKDKIYTKDM